MLTSIWREKRRVKIETMHHPEKWVQTPQKWVYNIWKDGWPQCRRRPAHVVEFKWENFTSLSICGSCLEAQLESVQLVCQGSFAVQEGFSSQSHTVTPSSKVCMYKNSYYIHLIFFCFVSFSSLWLENDPNCTIIRLNFSSLSFKYKSLTYT